MVIFCIEMLLEKTLPYLKLDLLKILIRTYLEHVWMYRLDINLITSKVSIYQ